MTTLGLGLYPLGLVGVGGWAFGDEVSAATERGFRVIDPQKRDYAQVSGKIQRTTSTRQRVITALSSRLKSSLSLRGIALPEYFSESTQVDLEREFAEALSSMTTAGEISITSVRIVTGADGVTGRLLAELVYFDTFGGSPVTLTIG